MPGCLSGGVPDAKFTGNVRARGACPSLSLAGFGHRKRVQTEHRSDRDQAPREPFGRLNHFAGPGCATERGKQRSGGRRLARSVCEELGRVGIEYVGADVSDLQADEQDDQPYEEKLIAIQVHNNADSREDKFGTAQARPCESLADFIISSIDPWATRSSMN